MSQPDEFLTYLQGRILILKDEEIKALEKGDRGDEAACSRLVHELDELAQWIKGIMKP